jgi:hypothetical protein
MPHVSGAGRGTFNPHPESVSDVLFIANPFLILGICSRSVTRCCVDTAWTKPRLSMWLSTSEFHARLSNSQAAFRKAGLSGLLPRHRGPREAHKLSEEVAEYVRAVRATAPGLTTVACLKALQEKFGIAFTAAAWSGLWRGEKTAQVGVRLSILEGTVEAYEGIRRQAIRADGREGYSAGSGILKITPRHLGQRGSG